MEVFGAPVFSYCRLETVDDGAIVADDGSLISILRVEGSLQHIGVHEFTILVNNLTEKLQSTLSKPGHAIQVIFEYDPESSEKRITEIFNPTRLTAQNLGLQIGLLLDDWTHALKDYCAIENCWFMLWIRPDVLPESLKKAAFKERDMETAKTPTIFGCQQISRAVKALHDAHNGFLTGVTDAFHQVDLICHELSVQEALKTIRICIAPEFTSPQWQPIVTGDPLPIRLPDPEMGKNNILHNTFYPDFKSQLWPQEAQLTSRTSVRIGDRIYGPLIMTLMPQTPKPFQDFFRVLARRTRRIPYRISFLL